MKVMINFQDPRWWKAAMIDFLSAVYSIHYRQWNAEENNSNVAIMAAIEWKLMAIESSNLRPAAMLDYLNAMYSLNCRSSNTESNKSKQVILQQKENNG